MSHCICAGACLCAAAVLGYAYNTYFQRNEIGITETNFKEVSRIHDKSNNSIV